MQEVPTVKIEDRLGGFIIINQADFDESVHRLYEEEKPLPELEEKPEEKPKSRRRKQEEVEDVVE